MTRRVLLTGASGFIGANLARRLLREGHEVHLLLRSSHQPWRIDGIRQDVTIHLVDLSDESTLQSVITRVRPDWIFHLAAFGAYPTQTDRRQMVETNVLQTANLLHACAAVGFDTFVNAGSSSEYGYKDHAPAEDELPEPNSEYAVTKLTATNYCRYIASKCGLRVPTLRLYAAYGPFEEPTRLIPVLITNGLAGRFPPLVNPDTARDFIYSEDVCDAFLALAEAGLPEPGAIFNVGSGRQTTLRDIVALARRLLPINAEPEWGTLPPRIWDTSSWVCNHRRLTLECGWTPRTSLETGLKQTVSWLQENPELWPRYQISTGT